MFASRALRTSVSGGFASLSVRRGISPRRLFRDYSEKREAESIFVHPSAIVHPDAVLGQGVSIGPFCVVGSAVKIGNGCQLHPGSHIMGNTVLGEHCTVLNCAIVGADIPGRTIIGSNNVIGHHAVVGIKCQDLKYKVVDLGMLEYIELGGTGRLERLRHFGMLEYIELGGDESFLHVGSNNDIREYSSIHRSSKSSETTVIGDNNLIMGSCHIAHDCKIGNNNIFANNTLLAGHVVVEDYAHTAGAIVVHQFSHIGSYSFVGGGSVITQDVPKYMMVSGGRAELRGLNLEGLRRHGFSSMEVRGLRRAYQKIFMHMNPRGLEDRLAEVEQDKELTEFPAVSSMVQSIRNSFEQSRRGICKFRNWSGS